MNRLVNTLLNKKGRLLECILNSLCYSSETLLYGSHKQTIWIVSCLYLKHFHQIPVPKGFKKYPNFSWRHPPTQQRTLSPLLSPFANLKPKQ